ncbi:transcriptional regulator [Escherichia coli]|nr:transcriptional regulator [Escherichia coli]
MSAYTVSQLAHNAGVSVHIVRDYRCAACYGRWPAPRAATACDDAALQRLCFVRAAFEAGIGWMPRRGCRALDAADGAQAAAQLPCCASWSSGGARALAHLDAQLASMPAERAHEEALP